MVKRYKHQKLNQRSRKLRLEIQNKAAKAVKKIIKKILKTLKVSQEKIYNNKRKGAKNIKKK